MRGKTEEQKEVFHLSELVGKLSLHKETNAVDASAIPVATQTAQQRHAAITAGTIAVIHTRELAYTNMVYGLEVALH